MRWGLGALLAACLSVSPAVAEPRWAPLRGPYAPGTGICDDGEINIICAVILCENGRLTVGILGTGHGGVQPPFGGAVEVDGRLYRRTMTGRIMNGHFLLTRTDLPEGGGLFRALRRGRQARLFTFSMSSPFTFSLIGLPPELDRVSRACG